MRKKKKKEADRGLIGMVSIEESIHRLRSGKTSGKNIGRGTKIIKGGGERGVEGYGRGNRENRKQLSLVYVRGEDSCARNLRVRKMHASMAAAAGRY